MIKILQILPSDALGVQQLAESIESSFPNKGFDITTAYLNPTGNRQASSKTKLFNFDRKETRRLKLKVLWQIFKYCRDEQFDVIITHRFKPLYLLLIINIFLKVPRCFSVIHGFDDFSRYYRRLLLRLFWTNNWRFVAISDSVENYLLRVKPNLANDRIITINNAINVNALSRTFKTKQDSRDYLKLNQEAFIFGTIGRLSPLKGHLHLIKAFESVHDKHPNAHLVIIGEGRARQEIEVYLANRDIQKSITLTGELANAAQYIKAFDIFVLPSLKEGFGMVLLEAMAAKLPIIASHTGGIPHVLGELGELVIPNNYPQSLSKKMIEQTQLTSNEREHIGNALHERLLKKFDEPSYQKQWFDLITRRV
ncbi:MAG: glycosyltransferase family 4 protein [Cycloclasticus sp.]